MTPPRIVGAIVIAIAAIVAGVWLCGSGDRAEAARGLLAVVGSIAGIVWAAAMLVTGRWLPWRR